MKNAKHVFGLALTPLALGLFAASLAVGRALAPSPAAASPSRTCVYCHGTTCGRGTVGGTNCVISPNSCSDGGTCDLT